MGKSNKGGKMLTDTLPVVVRNSSRVSESSPTHSVCTSSSRPTDSYVVRARVGDEAKVRTWMSTEGLQYQELLSLLGSRFLAQGRTQLHLAAYRGLAAETERLIASRCNVDLQDKDGLSPLHFAAGRGYEAVTKQLLEARCQVELQDEFGWTPLFAAANEGHASVTKQLIAARCNVNVQVKNGATPLFIAASEGHEAVTEQLLSASCNVDLRANNGLTALQAAERMGHAGISTLIQNQKGAGRAMKDTLLQASPEQIIKQQEDADRVMKELLEEEDKTAAGSSAVSVSHKKKQAKKAGKERDAADGHTGSKKEEHAEEKKDVERTEAKAESEKKTENAMPGKQLRDATGGDDTFRAGALGQRTLSLLHSLPFLLALNPFQLVFGLFRFLPIVFELLAAKFSTLLAALKDKAEEGRGKEEEKGKEGATERKKAEGASQGIQDRGLFQEKDDDDGFPDESPAKRKSKPKKRRAGKKKRGPLDEAEVAEKECCICLQAEELGKLLALVPCGHRIVCADCSALVVGHPCPVCRTEARQAIRVFD